VGGPQPNCEPPADSKGLPAFRRCLVLQTPGAVDVDFVQGQRAVAPDAITTLGPDLFGDRVNLYNGSFEFEHTDVLLPGNNALQVALVRRHTPGRKFDIRGAMADWDLNTPRIEGTFAIPEGWVPAYGTAATRCSGFSAPPSVFRRAFGSYFWFYEALPFEYWSGTNLVVPGHGSQEILWRTAGNTIAPTDGNSYPLVTRNQWQIGCLPSVQNSAGQGFFALSPDGIRYDFDWMATRKQPDLRKFALVQRSDFYLMASKVTDRFGNWVRYTYDASNPLNLQRIESSDGRLITLTYVANLVSTVSDGTRTWQYLYAQGSLGVVQQPDGSKWQFSLRTMVDQSDLYPDPDPPYRDCDTVNFPPWRGDELAGTITHPSGAVGRFNTAFDIHARTNVTRECLYYVYNGVISPWTESAIWSKAPYNQGLVSKEISGPGMETMTWRYQDGGSYWTEWGPCNGCDESKIVSVAEPNGSITAYTFGIMWGINEGQLLKVEENWNANTGVGDKATSFSYRNAVGQNYLDRFGISINYTGDYLSTTNRPQDRRVTTVQGVDFTWQVDPSAAGFDGLARPVKVNTFSSLGYSRTHLTEYPRVRQLNA
jgi:hypothetical protein